MKSSRKALALLALLSAAIAVAAGAPPPPRRLLIEVRDTPPQNAAAIRHGADGSYSVSTGSGGGDRDDRSGPADNSTTLSTGNSVRRFRIMEGERVRVDLPSVQSLQFHMPVPAAASAAAKGATGTARAAGTARTPGTVNAAGPTAGAGTAGAAGASGAGAAGTTGAAGTPATAGTTGAASTANAAAAPSVSGVVNFEAVAAFAARFALAGSSVRVELTPLPAGTITAPYAAAAGSPQATVTVQGRVGQWIALGDTELSSPARSLNATPDPVRPASVWVRVRPDPAAVAE